MLSAVKKLASSVFAAVCSVLVLGTILVVGFKWVLVLAAWLEVSL